MKGQKKILQIGVEMTLEDAERIVLKAYPSAHPFFKDGFGWSMCDGTRHYHGRHMIPGVGWHDTIEKAWMKAVEVIQKAKQAG